jgi:hypothetical protein
MNRLSSRRVVLAVILITMIIPACSALQIDLSPTQIPEGGQVTITIRGLANNSIFAIRIDSDTKPKADRTFDFRTTGFSMPFVLENGNFLVEAHNVMNKPPDNIAAGVKAKPPGSSGIISMQQGEYPEGVVQIYDMGRTIPAGTFDFISIFGNAKDGATVVPVSFEMNGKKKGPDDSEIRFNIFGVSSGSADILVIVDGNPQLSRTITIGSPPPTTTQTTIPTSVPTTPGTTTTTTSPVTQPSTATASPAVSTPPLTLLPDIISVSSMDKRCTLSTISSAVSGSAPDDIRIMNVGELPLSKGWYALSSTYLIFPETTRFSPKATVTLSMDDATVQKFDQYQPFIAMYIGGQWVAADTRRDGSRMFADISSGGKYALATQSVIAPAPTTAQQTKVTSGSQATGPQVTLSPPATFTESPQVATPTRKAGPAWTGCILVTVIAFLMVRCRKDQ